MPHMRDPQKVAIGRFVWRGHAEPDAQRDARILLRPLAQLRCTPASYACTRHRMRPHCLGGNVESDVAFS